MAAVGGVTCDLVRGVSRVLAPRVETWEVPGLDGYGAMTAGDGGSPGAFSAVRYESRANVVSWAESLAALQGTIVTVTDDASVSWSQQLVVSVSAPDMITAKIGAVTTRGEVRVMTVRVA